ncbi:MAG: nucleotide exchange factor GrpE [Verrucomicrobiales bacterium]|nr:nucleotide exchange factor GrpE [Verrucomicrobiales bacterium]
MREDLNPELSPPAPVEQPGLFEWRPLEPAIETCPPGDEASENKLETKSDAVSPPSLIPVHQSSEDEAEPAPGEDRFSETDATALRDWKAALRKDFEQWLDALDEIPETTEADLDSTDAPDLYSFYEQLATGNAEARKSNRRAAEAFSQWGETLSRFDGDLRLLREQLARLPVEKENALPRDWCLALVEILDRALRLAAAFDAAPPKSWWGRDAHWRKAWDTQGQGFSIVVSHLEELLKKAGVTRLSALHQPFDPATMAAVATAPNAQLPHHTVIEEIVPAYHLNGALLRVAHVKVSINKP